jgi:hypothetical protein
LEEEEGEEKQSASVPRLLEVWLALKLRFGGIGDGRGDEEDEEGVRLISS